MQDYGFYAHHAGIEDLDDIMRLGGMFFNESIFAGVTQFDSDRFYKVVRVLIEADMNHTAFLVLRDYETGEAVGFTCIYCEQVYTTGPVGEVYLFYIDPAHTGTGAARVMRDAVIEHFDEWGCVVSYMESGSDLDDPAYAKIFENLWAKRGYKNTGAVMAKKAEVE